MPEVLISLTVISVALAAIFLTWEHMTAHAAKRAAILEAATLADSWLKGPSPSAGTFQVRGTHADYELHATFWPYASGRWWEVQVHWKGKRYGEQTFTLGAWHPEERQADSP